MKKRGQMGGSHVAEVGWFFKHTTAAADQPNLKPNALTNWLRYFIKIVFMGNHIKVNNYCFKNMF